MTSPDPRRMESWRAARRAVEAAGWNLLGTGDWSWVYQVEDGDRVWRITPFDPAFDLFAELCLTFAGNPHLPRVDDHAAHPSGGSTTVMELLEPTPAAAAKKWLADFDSGKTPALAELLALLGDPRIGHDMPLFAGLDRNPANVMARASDGTLVLTDAFWIEGPKLLEMIKHEPEAAVALYPPSRLADWAHLPCMDDETTRLILKQLDAAS